uniref:Uncharacterized protein n=1 Tax=Anguilla anguilla TaxID=7936 RepID=A0A0E9Q3L2_ANGAN
MFSAVLETAPGMLRVRLRTLLL